MQEADAPVDGDALLWLGGIAKRWGDHEVLRGIDLDVDPGRLIRIKGANGAGKTTLLRITAGLLLPDAGLVSLAGRHPERQRRDFLRRLGFISAGDRALYPRLSARRHLQLCADLALLGRRERRAAVHDAIDAFSLAEFADRGSQRLSLGQRQRVRLAMGFVHNPSVVLLDEPANSLDDDGIAVLAGALERLRGRGGAAVWCAPSTTDPPLPFDERLVLADGVLVSE
jgi:ABC-2 type transport system ATP-binding protein